MKKYVGIAVCLTVLVLASGYVGRFIGLNESWYAHFYETEAEPAVLTADFPSEEVVAETADEAIAAVEATAEAETEMEVAPAFTSPGAHTYLTLPDLFENANPAVVAISIENTGRNIFGQTVTRPSAGSGFFVTPNGFIVTNDHVIENGGTITVLLYDGSAHTATLVGRDPASDIAVIKIDITNQAYLTFGDSDAVRVGEQVAAIGNPLGELANSLTVGWVSALNRNVVVEGTARYKIQTDAAVNGGNSGGPLLNLRGEVIGVVNAKSVGANVEGLGFAIPSNEARRVAEQLMDYGFVRGRAILGVSINEIRQQGTGNRMVQIAGVNRNSAADNAGMRIGDLILTTNHHPITTFESLRTQLSRLSPGDTMEITVLRNGEEVELTVILDEYRPLGL